MNTDVSIQERNRIIEENIGYLWTMVGKLWVDFPRLKYTSTKDDIFQESVFGMMIAINRWELESREGSLLKLASFHIRNQICRYMKTSEFFKVYTKKKAGGKSEVIKPPEMKLDNFGGKFTISPRCDYDAIDDKDSIKFCLSVLNEKEAGIISSVYGLDSVPCKAISVSRKLGIHESAVCQLKNLAFRKMRDCLEVKESPLNKIPRQSDFKDQWMPIILDLEKQGMQLRKIQSEIVKLSGRKLSLHTIHKWIKSS